MDKDSTIILGIDPGTRSTGYGVIKVSHRVLSPLDFGCIRPPTQAPDSVRYLALFNALDRLLEHHTPDYVAVETQFVSKNAQSALKLGKAQGMALLAAARRNIPIHEFAPSQAKLAVVGNGSASKEQVQRMIQLLLHLPHVPEPEDAADALALAICLANTLHFKQRLTSCSSISKGS